MHSAFQFHHYTVRRQVFALTGKLRFYNPNGQLVLFSEQKMFKLREDIRIFSDESKSQLVLNIKARQIIDFSAAYDVIDPLENARVGVLRRKGFSSLLRDKWEIMDANERPLAVMEEDSMQLALIRRFLLNLIPQNYDILMGQTRVVDVKQRFNLFRYELDVDFLPNSPFDKRLGIAAAVLLAIIEGRQE
ncbi:MAG: hypothetical protein H6636_06200 [Anaerolineales bacterium]|nr:hypothetical protein [Anaerolineales bacterium]